MKRMTGIGLVAVATVFLGHPARVLRGQESPLSRTSPRTPSIVLDRCLIKVVKTARLATDRPGVVASIEPKEGDAVREGQLVAKLMDEVAQANVDVAKRTSENTVEIEYAEKLNLVDRAEYLKAVEANRQQDKTFSDIEVQRLKLADERSRLQIDKAKHEMDINVLKWKQAEAELHTCWIKAPFDGLVTRVEKHKGEAVRQGDTILEIVNTAVVRVEGRVRARDIWNMRVGDPVTVHLSLGEEPLDMEKRANREPMEVEKKIYQGRIGFVDVVSDGSSAETRIWAEVANPENVLRPGLTATMTIYPNSGVATHRPVAGPTSGLESNTDRDLKPSLP
jgi:RND family efflux transporter MFP subunit